MTDSHDPDLRSLDDIARTASRGLHEHVVRRVDAEVALATLPAVTPPRGRGRFLAVAAVAALLVGSVVALSDHQGDRRSRLELDEDGNQLPTPQPGTLTPLGPRDGKNSIQLPVTMVPIEGLEDGDVVTVSSPGFEPGEQVGIVQCAREAGGDAPETRGGIDGCNTGSVEYADADAEGVATGRFTVQRVLTTPLTGTVDCSVEANRCLVAMGALGDYDRSGGFGFTIAGGEPIDIPSLTVDPDEGLRDGDVVRVRGDGFEPHEVLDVSVCSTDPSACWLTAGRSHSYGIETDGDGRVDTEVTVYRFLPGSTPGTYVDCSISACSLRVTGLAGPPPARLEFTADGQRPTPPAIAVDPTSALAPGDTVVVRGAGFQPGAEVHAAMCVAPPGAVDLRQACIGTDGDPFRVDDDGTFALEFELPDPADVYGDTATTVSCGPDGGCVDPAAPTDSSCDGIRSACAIVVDSYSGEEVAGPPMFAAVPVPVTFR